MMKMIRAKDAVNGRKRVGGTKVAKVNVVVAIMIVMSTVGSKEMKGPETSIVIEISTDSLKAHQMDRPARLEGTMTEEMGQEAVTWIVVPCEWTTALVTINLMDLPADLWITAGMMHVVHQHAQTKTTAIIEDAIIPTETALVLIGHLLVSSMTVDHNATTTHHIGMKGVGTIIATATTIIPAIVMVITTVAVGHVTTTIGGDDKTMFNVTLAMVSFYIQSSTFSGEPVTAR